jgi:hypothetical protein
MGGWKDYISYMTNENVTEHAHIFGHDGSVWASSTGLAAVDPFFFLSSSFFF